MPKKGKTKTTQAKAPATASTKKKNENTKKQQEEQLIDFSEGSSTSDSASDTETGVEQEPKRPATAYRPPAGTSYKKPRTVNENTMDEDFASASSSPTTPNANQKTVTCSDMNAQQSDVDHSGTAHKTQNGNQASSHKSNVVNLPSDQDKEIPRDSNVSQE